MSYIDELVDREARSDPRFAEDLSAECEKLDIAVALAQMRKEEGLTQKELAQRAHKPQSTIARIENGTLNPSVQLLSDIAHGAGRRLQVSFV